MIYTTLKELEILYTVNFENCDKSELVDIRTIKTDKEAPCEKRIADFISAVNNPYLFKVGDVLVKTTFNTDGQNFKKAFAQAISNN